MIDEDELKPHELRLNPPIPEEDYLMVYILSFFLFYFIHRKLFQKKKKN